jgi:two-component system cell cycle sensor histidine kinase/response regulator CckA
MNETRILIVEDDNIIALELADRLRELGYSVCGQVASGEDAIAQAGELRPDLVLMDIRLKGALDGVQATAEIRDRFDLPVVYLTAYADADTLQRAKATEPYGYILKPFEERELHTAIEIGLYKHRMEARLRASEQWLSTTLQSIGDAVLTTDERGHIVTMNPVAEALTGWALADAQGQAAASVFRLLDEEGRPLLENPIARVLREGTGLSLAGTMLVGKEGDEIPIDGNASPIGDERQHLRGIVLAFQDIRERRRQEVEREKLQAQLDQAQKMEAIGVLAGGIAHDFNNLMTTVIGSSSLMLATLAEDGPLREGLERIQYAGQRAAALTQQILALSRSQSPEPHPLDFDAVVMDVEEMLARLVDEDVEVVCALEPGRRYVQANPAQLEQAITNLILNAHEAMPGGGKLTIKAETVTSTQIDPPPAPETGVETWVCLSIADTGSGMAETTLEHIFEPFFTTKPKGNGLGLSIARHIVEQHQGWIEVDSELDAGTTFKVYLPALLADAAEAASPGAAPGAAPGEFRGRGEQVLLVEDDDGVRAAVSEMLRASGYRVCEAANAAQALAALDERGADLDLLLSDVVLPDRDGLQLVELCLAQAPGLPVLLTSGYTDYRSQWMLIRERDFRFLPKPFGLAELLPAVREALAAGSR